LIEKIANRDVLNVCAQIATGEKYMEAVDDERLMAAIGRIAVRAAELGEQIDLILRKLRPNEPAGKWHKLPLGLKLNKAIKASNNSNAGERRAEDGARGVLQRLPFSARPRPQQCHSFDVYRR
jgi:hypothetical protein